ncbi:hypothetical protein OIU34_20495 [Pararhizobium sp. BT-229]|uniref:hypothetical protein n=1 Tax=Pararhizobium sp. BT-229 TaxID=2986923 RepID=UPI0021F71A69|nr:hypothetical protein [Pararhizobium sp. BT-229]MCV9964269.1 hypothetical protein [Pararhizobium sp. BT-229]
MLKKEHMTPGVQLVVKDVIKDGVPSLAPGMPANQPKEYMSLFAGKVGGLHGREVRIVPGDILIVEKKPRKVDGVNLCRVRRAISQTVGEVYWCELRMSARLRDAA